MVGSNAPACEDGTHGRAHRPHRARHGAARRCSVRGARRRRVTELDGRRSAGRCGPRCVCRVRAVPAALSDVPAHRRGDGVPPRAHRRDARGRRRHRRGRRHLRLVHGPMPRLPGVRGRLSLARAVRPHDGARAHRTRAPSLAGRAPGAMDRARRRAAEAGVDPPRGRAAADRPAVHAPARAGADPTARVAVAAAAAGDRTARGGRGPRHRRRALGLRAGSVVPRR